MLTALQQNRFLRFLLVSSFTYLLLYLFYQFVIKKYTFLDQRFIASIINSSEFVLHLLGYKTFKVLDTFTILGATEFQVIGIDKSNGVWVGAACNAVTLIFLFAVFVLAYPGHQKSKIWFVPLGIVSIHILNIVRVCALALIAFYKPDLLAFNHTYTFTFIVYGYIFFLWMLWANKFSSITPSNENK